ncbi:O-antigen ligase [Curtobacterium sp. MCBD17_023]|uniref:O-antigen ligase family protein n=1 Tax=Curtobacterium sp. MCBD17_023 TaxID=2175657 RepID=UPI0015E8EA5E|nr:O-antigen ligase family protein [Curtobacterium sp. MCBD17_023]
MIDVAFALYIGSRALLEAFNSADVGHGYRSDVILQLVIYAAVFVACRLMLMTGVDWKQVLRIIVFPAPAVALLGLLQTVKVPAAEDLVLSLTGFSPTQDTAGGLARATSTVGHWTGLGAYLLVVLTALCLLAGETAIDGRRLVFALALVAGGILSTLTLAIITGAAFVALILLSRSASFRRRAVPIVALGAILTAFLSGPITARLRQQFGYNPGAFAQRQGWLPESLSYRIQIWESQTLPVVSSRPWTGWGQGFYIEFRQWGAFPQWAVWPSAESQWLLELVCGGIPQLVCLLLLIASIWRASARASQESRRAVRVLMAVSIASAFTVPIFTNAGYLGIALPLVALVCERNWVAPSAFPKPFRGERQVAAR